ncbi:MAG: hypothetical protein GX193_05095 [Clostridiales bacterium]|nr:hypothetical protein [Clostridiales bacterium]
MILKYLGTGSSEGIPSPFCTCRVCTHARKHGGTEIRHRTSAIIDNELLIDVTPDTFSQSVSLGIDLSRLKYILFTHTHSDHFYVRELINILPIYAHRKSRGNITVLSSSYAIEEIRNTLGEDDFSALSQHIDFTELAAFTPYTLGDFTVTALQARHPSQSPYIYLIEKQGRRILYANDTGYLPEATWDYIAGIHLDIVSLDCTHLTESGTAGHMCIEDDITTIRRLFQLGNVTNRTVFAATHFSHNGNLTHSEIDERLRLHGIITSYDGLEIRV